MAKQRKADVALQQAVQALETVIAEGVPHRDTPSVMLQLQGCAETPQVSHATLDEVIRRLAALAENLDLLTGTLAVFGCGLCIENGGNAEPAVAATLRFARESVRHAAAIYRLAAKPVKGDQGLIWEEISVYLCTGGTPPPLFIRSPDPTDTERVAASLYALLSPALFNVLKHSRIARETVRADEEFLRDLEAFAAAGECPESWVPRLLREAEKD